MVQDLNTQTLASPEQAEQEATWGALPGLPGHQ